MCGIFGISYADNNSIDIALLHRVTSMLRHRGPDDEGYLLADTSTNRAVSCGGPDTDPRLPLPSVGTFTNQPFNLAFGFRRLAIIDLSPAGHQPMASPDGHSWIVFNGEIYNYLELRSKLEAQGFAFHSHSDTEVILAAYKHYGLECLKHFIGMWAFAIWDRQKQQLFLARDPFGIKPLYYVQYDQFFAFASETKALLQLPEVGHRVNPACLYDFLNSGLADYGAGTFFEDIKQLPPAHYMILQLSEPKAAHLASYWQVDSKQHVNISFAEAAQRLRELFLNSVRLHLRSDVPVGTALSGGIDSSSIVSAMRHLCQDELEIHTFSFAADDPLINEERWVDMVGAANNALIHKVRITPEELVTDLDHLIYTHDMPFGSTSVYAQYRVFRLSHEAGIKVMLDGQGSDEFLAGYMTYHSSRLASLIRQRNCCEAIRFWQAASSYPGQNWMRMWAEAWLKAAPEKINAQLWRIALKIRSLVPPNPAGFIRRLSQKQLGLPTMCINQQWFNERGVSMGFNRTYDGAEILKGNLLQTLTETSLPTLLRVEDRNSMAFSIESRVPFLTTELVSFVFSLPEDFIIAPDATTKAVFRLAMRNLVPDPILNRKDKIGFATPEKDWLTTLRPWVDGVLQSDVAAQIPALVLKGLSEEWQAVLAGTRRFDWHIWRWLNLIRWTEQFGVVFR